MKYYIDGFRGIEGVKIDMSPLMLFVGENSTGKTSLLKLLYLMEQGDELQQNFSFESKDNFAFSTFKELTDGNRVRIGKMFLKKENSKEYECAMLSEYTSFKNRPYLTEQCLYTNGVEIVITREADSTPVVKYRVSKPKSAETVLDSWVKLNQSNEGYITATLGNEFLKLGSRSNVYMLLYLGLANNKQFIAELKKYNMHNFSVLSDFLFSSGNSPRWFAPIRSEPQSVYEKYITFDPQGKHFASQLESQLKDKNSTFSTKLFQYGKESNLFDSLTVQRVSLLSNLLEVRVKVDGKIRMLKDVGYGVSQALPLVVSLLQDIDRSVFIQEPEVHLHPLAQSAFGAVLASTAVENKNKYFIETHSDFLVDRIRREVRDRKITASDVQLFFFQRKSRKVSVFQIKIDSQGKYYGDGVLQFRKFFLEEAFKNISL